MKSPKPISKRTLAAGAAIAGTGLLTVVGNAVIPDFGDVLLKLFERYGISGIAVGVIIIALYAMYKRVEATELANTSIQQRLEDRMQAAINEAAERYRALLQEFSDYKRDTESDRERLEKQVYEAMVNLNASDKRIAVLEKQAIELLAKIDTLSRELNAAATKYEDEHRKALNLEADNNRLTVDNQQLIKSNTKLSEEIDTLRAQVEHMQTRITALESAIHLKDTEINELKLRMTAQPAAVAVVEPLDAGGEKQVA